MADLLERIAAERARRTGNPSMPDHSPQAQTAHAARLAGTDPVQGQAAPGGTTAFPEQTARMAAISRRREALQNEMARDKAEYEAETANNWRFPAPAETAQTQPGGPPGPEAADRPRHAAPDLL